MTAHTSPAPRASPAAQAGVWLAASYVLDRPISTTKPYPHLCHFTVYGLTTGRPVRLTPRDCAACIRRYAGRRREAPDIPAPRGDMQALAAGEETR